MEFYKRAIKVGNSAGVLLPKSLLGARVKVSILSQPLNVKKDVLQLLDSYFEEIKGIYLMEMKTRSIEILAISNSLRKTITSSPYKIDIVPFNIIKKNEKALKKLKQVKVILNKSLVSEFTNCQPFVSLFKCKITACFTSGKHFI